MKKGMLHAPGRISRYTVSCLLLLSMILFLPLLTACGASAVAQQEPPTPTPLPPAPALERPTYVVQRNSIERSIELNGRVMPVNLVRLSFHHAGRVEMVNVARGDLVQAGMVLAELQQTTELHELRQAEKRVVQTQRDLEEAQRRRDNEIQQAQNELAQAQRSLDEARAQREREIANAERTVQNTQEDLARLLPEGTVSVARTRNEELEEAQRKAKETRDSGSLKKTNAEIALRQAAEALQKAQREYSDAYWDWDWVQRYGSNPEPVEQVDPVTGETEEHHEDLNDSEERDYEIKFIEAEQALHKAEQDLELAERELEIAREEEIYLNQQADKDVAEAQRKLDDTLQGDEESIISARRAIEDAQRTLEEKLDSDLSSEEAGIENAQLAIQRAMDTSFDTELTAIEDAMADLEEAQRKVEEGRLIAPQAGQVLALGIGVGDEAEAFKSVIEIADPSQLEIGAELSAEQMRQLAEGLPVEVSLLARPDVRMPAVIRRLPAPYGSGGSGAVQEEDRTTRFEMSDTRGQQLTSGAVAKIHIVLERKDDVLLLPPDAIRSFEGRRFVVLRQGDTERRVPVRVGIETEEHVEILEGVKEGDVIVGQ